MSCTPEEIDRKRRLALEKLQSKKFKISTSPVQQKPAVLQPQQSNNANQFRFKRSTSGNFGQIQQTHNNQNTNVTKQTANFSPNVNGYGQSGSICSAINKFSANSVPSPSTNKIHSLQNQQTQNTNVSGFGSKQTANFSPNVNSNGKPNSICSTINKFSANSVPSASNVNSPGNSGISPQKFFGDPIVGSSYVISETRFEVNIRFHEQVISIFRSIPSALYNPENKQWNFHIQDYNTLISKLAPLQPHVTIEKIPTYVLNLLTKKNQSSKNENINLDKIDPELLNILMPFQREGVLFAIHNNGKCLIADEMGLGKTLQSLAVASYYRQDWPLLIVTTSSMKNTWEESIHKFLPSVPLAYIRYMSSGKDYISDAEILIVSYDLMARCTDALVERKFGFLIMDESHTIKNFKAKCTKSAITLSKSVKRVILLSGTPALSRPSELYSQLSLIDQRFFGTFFDFSKRYCDGQSSRFGWDASGKSNLTELEVVLKKKFMIRRTKNEVLHALPEKSREVIRLDVGLHKLSETDRLSLSTLVDNYTSSKKGQEKHCLLLQLFSQSARIKIPSVCLYIENLLKNNEKFLVFAHHQVMLDAICRLLDKNKKKFIRIDGNTNSEQRQYFINKFQLQDDCIAAVLSITAANAGITLTAAKLVLFAELHWNPSILAQAESRAHRIGQQNDVIARYLLAFGTADDHIWPLLESKQNVLNEVGLSKDTFKDATISEQVICSPSNLTRAGTKSITDFFQKSQEPLEADKTLEDFLTTDDDDMFVNADFDF